MARGEQLTTSHVTCHDCQQCVTHASVAIDQWSVEGSNQHAARGAMVSACDAVSPCAVRGVWTRDPGPAPPRPPPKGKGLVSCAWPLGAGGWGNVRFVIS